jgi:hypothetical protein
MFDKLKLKSVKNKIVIVEDEKPVKKVVDKKPVESCSCSDKKPIKKIDDNKSDDEINKLLKEIENLNKNNNTNINNDFPNVTSQLYLKRLNYLLNLGVNLKDYDKDMIYFFVNKSWNHNSKRDIDKDEVRRLMMELNKKGFNKQKYGINSRLSHLFKLFQRDTLSDENIQRWTKKQIRTNLKALSPQEKTNLIIKELHNGQKKKSLSMLNSLKIDISKDDFNEIKEYIENFKSN